MIIKAFSALFFTPYEEQSNKSELHSGLLIFYGLMPVLASPLETDCLAG